MATNCDNDYSLSDFDAGFRYADLEFGVFIHYGINTYAGETGFGDSETWQPATEYPATGFTPTAEIDIRNWLRPAKMAGCKYAIFTAKHHFGWCAWPTATTTYDIASANDPQAPTDLVDDFVTACNEMDIKPILYYSIADRHYNPDGTADGGAAGTKYRMDGATALAYMESQLTELLDGTYGDIYGVWLDVHAYIDNTQKAAVYDHIKGLQPDCVVIANNNDSRLSDECTSIIDGTSDVFVAESVVIPEGYSLPIEEIDKIVDSESWWGFSDDLVPTFTAQDIKDKRTLANAKGGAYCIGIHVGPNGSLSAGQGKFMRDLAILEGNISNSIGVNTSD